MLSCCLRFLVTVLVMHDAVHMCTAGERAAGVPLHDGGGGGGGDGAAGRGGGRLVQGAPGQPLVLCTEAKLSLSLRSKTEGGI